MHFHFIILFVDTLSNGHPIKKLDLETLQAPCRMKVNNYKKFLEDKVYNFVNPLAPKEIKLVCEEMTHLEEALQHYGRLEFNNFLDLPHLGADDFLTVIKAWEGKRNEYKFFLSSTTATSSTTPTTKLSTEPSLLDQHDFIENWTLIIFLIMAVLYKIVELLCKVCRYKKLNNKKTGTALIV